MKSINFLYDQDQHFLDKFVAWALTYGRAIVMLTEVIAMLAFLYRFGLDRQLVDLHDKIKGRGLIVSASRDSELLYRNLQHRLSLSNQYDKAAITSVQQVVNTIDAAKGNVTFMNVTYAATNMHMSVIANSSSGLHTFVNSLRSLPTVSNVSIDSVQNRISSGQIIADISVTITAGGATN